MAGRTVDAGEFKLPGKRVPDSARYLATLQVLNSIIAIGMAIFLGSILSMASMIWGGAWVAVCFVVLLGGFASYSGLRNLEHFSWRLALITDVIWFLALITPISTGIITALLYNPVQLSLYTPLLPWFGGLAALPLLGIVGLCIPKVRKQFV